MNEHQTAQRGLEASQVLGSEAYIDAMIYLKEQVIQQWKACPVRDREGQLLLLQLAKLADKFDSILTGMVESGKYAQHKIDIDDLRDESKLRRFMRKVA
jgi:hypothetical protein